MNHLITTRIEKLKSAHQQALEEDLADTRTQLDETQKGLAPRILTTEQQARITESLRRAPSVGDIRLGFPSGDVEAAKFATQIADAIVAAGWTISSRMSMLGTFHVGLIIMIRDEHAVPPPADYLTDALNEAGLKVDGLVDPQLPAQQVLLIVGQKP